MILVLSLASASLAHDIGNPPFGHSGEKSIGQYFISGSGKQFQKILNEKEFKDLCDFEGNANGFKILTQSRPGRGRWDTIKLCNTWYFC